jgi:hypothetical protein
MISTSIPVIFHGLTMRGSLDTRFRNAEVSVQTVRSFGAGLVPWAVIALHRRQNGHSPVDYRNGLVHGCHISLPASQTEAGEQPR